MIVGLTIDFLNSCLFKRTKLQFCCQNYIVQSEEKDTIGKFYTYSCEVLDSISSII